MSEKQRVALYARVSTLQAQDPAMQLTELREYAARRGWKVVEEYVDRMSGVRESRPALNRMMHDARRRKFDVIVVWKIDRFGRSLKHLVNALAELEALGLDFVSLRDNLDLGTPAGRLMFQIIGAMAEFERSLIQERVRAGLRNAKQKGKRLGRPPRPGKIPSGLRNVLAKPLATCSVSPASRRRCFQPASLRTPMPRRTFRTCGKSSVIGSCRVMAAYL
jgi:DNA invertase Pin-like site-specific DNA recombinase